MTMGKTFIREGREEHEENHKNFAVEPLPTRAMRFVSGSRFCFLRVSSRPSRTKRVFA
jgi:hypothetical protein